MPRQRSLSITPTYSTDRATLRQRKPTAIASTVQEAITILLSLNICNDATFQKRANLTSQEEWTAFLESSTDPSQDVVDLEAALKKCYAMAYSMPPSPMAQNRSSTSVVGKDPTPLSV